MSSEAHLVDELQKNKRPVADVRFKKSQHQSASFGHLNVDNLLLTETSTDSITWKASIAAKQSFVIPIRGSGAIVASEKPKQYLAPRCIVNFSFSHLLEVHNEASLTIAIVPQRDELNKAISAFSSKPEEIIERFESAPTEVHLGIFNRIDYYRQLMDLIAIAGSALGDEEFLKRIGLAGIMTRVLAAMVTNRGHFEPGVERSVQRRRSDAAVDLICDHIQAYIGTPLTIPRMENLTKLSGRALGYAFQSRFGCSPQEWQRNHLLNEARRLLITDGVPVTVKSIAYGLGFSSSSSFSTFYKKRFGELPTQTANAARKKSGRI